MTKYSVPITHKQKPTKIVVGTVGFDNYYKTVGFDGNNKLIKLPVGLEGRLDLISLQVYGTVNRWWEIAIANNIFDPVEQMKAGMLLKIPKV